jgi:hypothetical protein
MAADLAIRQKYMSTRYNSLHIEGCGKMLDIIRWSNDELSIIINGKEPALCVDLKDISKLPINLTHTHENANKQWK